MENLKFGDTHNMVAFLSKPEESDGFEQIVDFECAPYKKWVKVQQFQLIPITNPPLLNHQRNLKRHKNLGSLKKDTQVPQPSDPSEHIADEAVYRELGDSLVRAATTA
ncbi:hypothetical protein Tco_1520285, partial [Tanacetum coccineum]